MLGYLEDGDQLEPWTSQRNLARQYDFMNSAFVLWQYQSRPLISPGFLSELNFYAAHLLSPHPGRFRHETKINVDITGTPHKPPTWQEVEVYLSEFISEIHKRTQSGEKIETAAYALWRLNWIHPFAQGNGRTSRALCYFLLCQDYDLWLPGNPILPELIKRDRDEYCSLLKAADSDMNGEAQTDLTGISTFLERLLYEQLSSAAK